MCRFPLSPEEVNDRSPEARVPHGCEPRNMAAGNGTLVPLQGQCALNYSIISESLNWLFLFLSVLVPS